MVEGQRHTFEVLGLVRGLFTMVDLQTGSVWNHFDGRSTEGPLEGSRMKFLPVQMMTWDEWKRLYRDTVVVDGRTGFEENYYEFVPGSESGVPEDFADDRLPSNALVIGVQAGGEHKAYPQDLMAGHGGVFNDTVGGASVLVMHNATTGAGLAYSRMVDGQVATFSADVREGRAVAVDSVTASVWNDQGVAIDGPMLGSRLEWVDSFVTQWYGWADYYPDTEILGTPADWARVTAPPVTGFRY